MYNLALTQMLGTRQESVNTLHWNKKERLEAQVWLEIIFEFFRSTDEQSAGGIRSFTKPEDCAL